MKVEGCHTLMFASISFILLITSCSPKPPQSATSSSGTSLATVLHAPQPTVQPVDTTELGWPIYTSKFDRWTIRWTYNWANVSTPSVPGLIEIYTALHETSDGSDSEDTHYSADASYRMLSVVGPIVSYLRRWETEGSASTSFGGVFTAIDVSRHNQKASIVDLFDSNAVYQLLMADSLIQRYLVRPSPNCLSSLCADLQSPDDIDFGHILNQFAVKSISGDSAVVEFGLSHYIEAAKGHFTRIDITLPIPKTSSDIFKFAQVNKYYIDNLAPHYMALPM